jgi:hypothetical protein
MTRASILFCLALLPPLLAASPSRAQSAEDRAAADALYAEAGELIQAQRFAEACPKLETSQRLDPGIGTMIRLGFCFENIGRTASAWNAYNEAEALARRKADKRADDAVARAKALEPRLSRLTITPKSPAQGQEVRRDGKALDAGLWNFPVPVDPGEHLIEASAPGRRTWTTKVTIMGPGTTTVEVLPLADGPLDPRSKATAPAPYWNGQRAGGLVLGGVGLAGIVVGSVFGAQTFSKNSASMAYCPTVPTMCYAQGVMLRGDAYSASTISTISFVAGGAMLVGGAITFFTATKAAPKSVTLTATPRSLAVRGDW